MAVFKVFNPFFATQQSYAAFSLCTFATHMMPMRHARIAFITMSCLLHFNICARGTVPIYAFCIAIAIAVL